MYNEEKATVLDDCLVSVRRTFIRSVIGTASVLGITAGIVFGDPTLLHANSINGILTSLKTDWALVVERAPKIAERFGRRQRDTVVAANDEIDRAPMQPEAPLAPAPTLPPKPTPQQRSVLAQASNVMAQATEIRAFEQPLPEARVAAPAPVAEPIAPAPQPVVSQPVAQIAPPVAPAPIAKSEPAPVAMKYVVERQQVRRGKTKSFMVASADPNGGFIAGGGPGGDTPPSPIATPITPPVEPANATSRIEAPAAVAAAPVVESVQAVAPVQASAPVPMNEPAQPVEATASIEPVAAPHGPEPGDLVWLRLPVDKPPLTPAQRLNLTGKERVKQEACLARAVYFESRAEPVRGQEAVAQVVLNRVFSPYYPKDICSVVYQNASHHLACQFTFACDGKPDTIRERGAWARANRVARETLDAKIWLPEVAKSTHYHAAYVHPYWARSMRKLARFGLHSFYRPRNWGDGSNEPAWGAGAKKKS